jgi:Flp pilus assembly protein TadG
MWLKAGAMANNPMQPIGNEAGRRRAGAAPCLARCNRAVASLEFAAVGSILVLLLAGCIDFGLAYYYRALLAGAVSAGAEYAVLTGASVSSSNIRSVVSGTLGFTPDSNTATVGTYCIQNSPAALVAQTGGTCSDGSAPGTYAIVTAGYTPPFPVPLGSFAGFAVSESASVRLQ